MDTWFVSLPSPSLLVVVTKSRRSHMLNQHKLTDSKKKMFEIMTEEAAACDLKELVIKVTSSASQSAQDAIAVRIKKACQGIYPLQNTYVRKIKILKASKFDVSALLALHGGAAAASDDTGAKASKEFVEPPILASV
ncbi:unnamed protein product [Rhizopus stolonifer]